MAYTGAPKLLAGDTRADASELLRRTVSQRDACRAWPPRLDGLSMICVVAATVVVIYLHDHHWCTE
jgi:hypothetical protein